MTIVLEMEIQKRADTDEEIIEDDIETENSEKRLYNGFQGPLTETEENSLQPDTSSGNSASLPNLSLLSTKFFLVIFLLI